MFAVGDRLGAYVIGRRIGEGGMGEVYFAEHVHISRKAAIKVLLPELSSRPDIVERFFNEARATASLRHPNIVEILDCDVHASGRAFIVMEFLEGETLGHSLARIGNFAGDVTTAAAIAGQLAGALAASHGKGIIHRDLKPDNIFLAAPPDPESPLRVKILDFGIAKLLGEGASQSRRTRTGSVLGTPIYMSPEQCRGAGHVDHRSDIYSLGCIIFELLAGQPPFVREGHGELIIAHNSEPPPELASLVPSVPPALAALVARMLVKDPGQRTQTMAEVVSAIEGILRVPSSQFAKRVTAPAGFPAGGAVEPRPASPPVPTPRTLLQPQPGQTKLLPNRDTTLSHGAVAVTDPPPPPPTSRLGVKIGVGVSVLAAGAAALFFFLRRPEPQANDLEPPVVSSPRPATATPSEPRQPAKRFATIELEGAPDGLTVTLDGKPTTVPIAVPAGQAVHDLRFEAAGFEPRELKVDGGRDRSIVLEMTPVAVATPPRAGRPAKIRPARGQARPAAEPGEKNEKDDAFRDL